MKAVFFDRKWPARVRFEPYLQEKCFSAAKLWFGVAGVWPSFSRSIEVVGIDVVEHLRRYKCSCGAVPEAVADVGGADGIGEVVERVDLGSLWGRQVHRVDRDKVDSGAIRYDPGDFTQEIVRVFPAGEIEEGVGTDDD